MVNTHDDSNDINTSNNSNSHSSNNNGYIQIATPKSPNSDGLSPIIIEDDLDEPIKNNLKQKLIDEIDIEILLKHREYNLVQDEIYKIESNLDIMTKIHDDPIYASYLNELINLKKNQEQLQIDLSQSHDDPYHSMRTRRSSMKFSDNELLNHEEQDNQNPYHHHYGYQSQQHRTSYGGLRPVIDANGNKICVHKRSDGIIVRVECPVCGRTDFGSAQGFLNHARLAHQIEYKSQDHAALLCGYALPDADQDEVGIQSLKKLRELKLNPDRELAPGAVRIDDVNESNSNSKGTIVEFNRKRQKKVGLENSSHLKKLYNSKKNIQGDEDDDNDEFKKLVENVMTKEKMDDLIEDETEGISPGDTTGISTPNNQNQRVNKKSHNRRKSRGGLSAVKFDDTSLENIIVTSDYNADISTSVTQDNDILDSSINTSEDILKRKDSSDLNSDSNKLTPAQRRRVPTIPNPLRTRSRSSRGESS